MGSGGWVNQSRQFASCFSNKSPDCYRNARIALRRTYNIAIASSTCNMSRIGIRSFSITTTSTAKGIISSTKDQSCQSSTTEQRRARLVIIQSATTHQNRRKWCQTFSNHISEITHAILITNVWNAVFVKLVKSIHTHGWDQWRVSHVFNTLKSC